MSGGRPPHECLHEWGCVHGRFQPFHLGHLEYALLAKERCRRLLVGVTNPDPSWVDREAVNAHRHEAESNPFTYLERALMVRDSLLDEGLGAREFVVAPFPIQEPGLCRYYVPEGAMHFVRVYSEWEEEKVRRLRAHGFAVEILDPGKEKGLSGMEIRRLIRRGFAWEHTVPTAVAPIIREVVAGEPQRFGSPGRLPESAAPTSFPRGSPRSDQL